MTIFDNPAGAPTPPAGRYSHVASIDLGDTKLLILSGQLAIDAEGKLVGPEDMTAQAEFILDTVATILAAHGATFEHVVNVRSYLTDMDRLGEYAAARMKRFTGPPPTSTAVEVSRLAALGALLEVEVTAVV